VLAATVAFVVLVGLTPPGSWWAFVADGAALTVLAALARVGPRHLARRLRVLAPFLVAFLGVAVWAGGPRVRPFDGWPVVESLTVSAQGWVASVTLASRAVLGVTAGVVLVATVSQSELVASARRLRVPALIVEILGFVLRYTDLLADRFAQRSVAMAARGARLRHRSSLRPLAASTGTLFVRSFEQAERVSAAMASRGYAGSLPLGLVDLPVPVAAPARRARRAAPLLPLVAALGLVSTWL
jgi:cobalt/nickel transport system permease protein